MRARQLRRAFMFNHGCSASPFLHPIGGGFPPQRHLPVSEDNIRVYGVMHRQGVTRNIHIYFQSPPSRLHPYTDGAPSTDNRLRSLSNELALDTLSHMSSKRCQKYSQIFAVPYIVAALISLHSAIYRHSREIII